MAQYDRKIIIEFADQLYRRANTIIAVFTIAGAIIGLYFGYGLGASGNMYAGKTHGAKSLIYALIAGGMGGAAGFYIGTARAFSLKLQAQMALCQTKIEQNTGGDKSLFEDTIPTSPAKGDSAIPSALSDLGTVFKK